jgi:hypothetical protein
LALFDHRGGPVGVPTHVVRSLRAFSRLVGQCLVNNYEDANANACDDGSWTTRQKKIAACTPETACTFGRNEQGSRLEAFA